MNTVAPGEMASLAMGDALGGVLLSTWSESEGILRLTADGTGSWRRDGVAIKGQAGDGTIYALEAGQWIVVLDGQTGAERGRVELARSTRTLVNSFDAPRGDLHMYADRGLLEAGHRRLRQRSCLGDEQ